MSQGPAATREAMASKLAYTARDGWEVGRRKCDAIKLTQPCGQVERVRGDAGCKLRVRAAASASFR